MELQSRNQRDVNNVPAALTYLSVISLLYILKAPFVIFSQHFIGKTIMAVLVDGGISFFVWLFFGKKIRSYVQSIIFAAELFMILFYIASEQAVLFFAFLVIALLPMLEIDAGMLLHGTWKDARSRG